MKEEWKDIEGFEGFYQVSNKGRVKSLSRISDTRKKTMFVDRILKQSPDGKGYMMVWLYKGSKRYTKKVHRLVAKAFIPNPQQKPQIDHIDTIRINNSVENLRWVTPSENCLNPISLQRNIAHVKGGRNGYARRVFQYSLSNEFIQEWECINDAIRALGLKNHSHIVQSCRGERRSAYGYKWSYAK